MYTEWFKDDSGVVQPFVPAKKVLVDTSKAGKMLCGAVTQLEYEKCLRIQVIYLTQYN